MLIHLIKLHLIQFRFKKFNVYVIILYLFIGVFSTYTLLSKNNEQNFSLTDFYLYIFRGPSEHINIVDLSVWLLSIIFVIYFSGIEKERGIGEDNVYIFIRMKKKKYLILGRLLFTWLIVLYYQCLLMITLSVIGFFYLGAFKTLTIDFNQVMIFFFNYHLALLAVCFVYQLFVYYLNNSILGFLLINITLFLNVVLSFKWMIGATTIMNRYEAYGTNHFIYSYSDNVLISSITILITVCLTLLGNRDFKKINIGE